MPLDEEAPGEHVAALLADDVHLRAAGGRLAKPAAQAEHHFLRVADLGHVARHAHALVAAVHAVDEDLSLVPAPAVDLEHAVERRVGAFEIVALHVDRRDEMREGGILSRRRNLGDRLAADHLLVARARHVDDGRFAGDVIVSATPPTFMSAFTVAMNVPVSSIPSRLTVANPFSVKVTV